MIIIPNGTLFASRILRLRKKYYLSQRALSALIGVSVYSLRGWEEETLVPMLSNETLSRLCQVFNTTAATFCAESPCD